MRVAIFNACESLNIGDQIISDCTIYLLKKYVSDNVSCYDVLTGRELNSIKEQAVKNNSGIGYKRKKINVPKIVSTLKYLLKHKLYAKKYIENKEQAVKNADLIYIGGGHLLIDTAGIFAINIDDIVRSAKKNSKKIIIGMVGVRMPWSIIASYYFNKLLKYSTFITVRDSFSEKALSSSFSGMAKKISATMDPAIFVDEVYANSVSNPVYDIGLCLISPAELTRAGAEYMSQEITDFWTNLYQYLSVEKKLNVCFFTNGSLQDESFLDGIENIIPINRLSKPRTSNELMVTINTCKSLIAQRLHTCLPALSINKQVVGIKWDSKLEHIFNDLGVSENIVTFKDQPEQIYNKIVNAQLVSFEKKTLVKKSIINGLRKINEKNS